MARLIGFILMLVGIYLGVVVYTEGSERAFGGLFASADEAPAEAMDGAYDAAALDEERGSGAPAPRPVTARVRDKVQGAVDARADRVGAN